MPILFTVDHSRREVLATSVGPVVFGDVRAHLAKERHWQGLAYPELIDTRAAALSLSPAEIREIVELLQRLDVTSHLERTEVQVTSDYRSGIVRTLEALVEDVCEIKPFRDEAAAHLRLAEKSRAAT